MTCSIAERRRTALKGTIVRLDPAGMMHPYPCGVILFYTPLNGTLWNRWRRIPADGRLPESLGLCHALGFFTPMPRPVLQALVLADHVYQDRSTGKFLIAGTFSRLWISTPKPAATPNQPVTFQSTDALSRAVSAAGSPHLYVALSDVHGSISLTVRYVDLSNGSNLFEMVLGTTSSDPLALTELGVPLPRLPMPHAGAYSLDVLHDGEILGSWRLVITQDTPPANTEKPG